VPAPGRDSVPQNAVLRSVYIGNLPKAAEDIKLFRDDGTLVETKVSLEPMAQKMMLCTMTPTALLLPPGKYKVVTAAKPEGATTFTVTAGSDAIAPGALTKVSVKADFTNGAYQITSTFDLPADDRTPADVLASNVYLAKDPAEPDVNALPTLSTTRVTKTADGRGSVVISSNDIDLAPRTQLEGGKWKMRVRAVDEAGNLGAPSESVSFTLPDAGSRAPEGGCACMSSSAAPGKRPTLGGPPRARGPRPGPARARRAVDRRARRKMR
jgi:hypothetical protein